MIHRSFTLYDETGTAKSLNGEPEGSELYFENPTGLGFNLAPTFANIGSGFFKNISSDKIPQQSIVGDMIFSNYAAYTAFVRWVLKAKKLYFAYRPTPTDNEYRCEVAVDYLTKTEKNAGTNLRCPISFKPLTLWYTETVPSYELSPDGSALIAELPMMTSDIPAAIRLELVGTGEMGNIIIRLDPHGSVDPARIVGSVTLDGLILDSGGTIAYSSAYGDSYVTKNDGTVTTDLINIVDITENPWIRISNDMNYDLRVMGTGVTTIPTVKVYEYYRSV